MTLTSVVLPAPFGPIKPWIEPCSTSSDTPSTARTPPKCRWTLSRRRSTDISTWPPPRLDDRETTAADDALRPEHDHCDQEEARDDVDVGLRLLEVPRQARDNERPHHGSEEVSAATEHREGQDLHRPRHAVLPVSRVDEKVEMCFQPSGETRQNGAQDEGDHLVPRHVDALAQRSELVLPDRRPRCAKPSLRQPPHEKQDDGQRDQDHVDPTQRIRVGVL